MYNKDKILKIIELAKISGDTHMCTWTRHEKPHTNSLEAALDEIMIEDEFLCLKVSEDRMFSDFKMKIYINYEDLKIISTYLLVPYVPEPFIPKVKNVKKWWWQRRNA